MIIQITLGFCAEIGTLGKIQYPSREIPLVRSNLMLCGYQCPQCTSTCKWRNVFSEEQTIPCFLKFDQGFFTFKRTLESSQVIIGDVYRSGMFSFQDKSVWMEAFKNVWNVEHAAKLWTLPSKTGNRQLCCLAVTTIQNWKTISFFKRVSTPITISYTQTVTKKGENHSICGIIVSTIHWLIQVTENSLSISFYTLSL